jgi:signal transduction histidine kinase
VAGIVAVGVLGSIIIVGRGDRAALSEAVLDQQRLLATTVAAEVATDSGSSLTSGAVERMLEAERRALAGTGERIFLVDASGEGIGSVDARPAPAVVEALEHAAAPGTLDYTADDREYVAGFAPVAGVDWWVVAQRTGPGSTPIIDDSADYLIALLAISLIALLALTAASFAKLRDRLAVRTDGHDRAETEAILDRFTFLANATGDLSTSLDLETTLQRAACVAVPTLADWCTVHLISDSGKIETVARAAADPDLESAVDELQQHYPPAIGGLSPGAQALQSAQPVLVTEVTQEWLASTAVDAAHLSLLERLNPRAVMGIPLIARNRILGAMTFASVTPQRRYDAASLALATALARRCALAIDNARLYRETQDALRAREEFLSIASHELGGPLARLALYTELLTLAQSRNEIDDSLLTRSLGSIDRAINRLRTITQDLLDVARWAGGEIPIRPARMELGQVVREFVASYRQRFTGNHQLTVRVARGKHMVSIDVNRLEQVFENLLDNAFKYSPEGGKVQVAVRPERGGVLVEVTDTGIGLPPGTTDCIFEPFGRAPNAERRSISGMGLGLYICRRIVERHGGRIWAESPGELQGTTMNVWLPGAYA